MFKLKFGLVWTLFVTPIFIMCLVDGYGQAVFLHYFFQLLHKFVAGGSCLHGLFVAYAKIFHHAKIMVGQKLHHAHRVTKSFAKFGGCADILLVIVEKGNDVFAYLELFAVFGEKFCVGEYLLIGDFHHRV